jgi:succinate dehydrogenase/fumarate reductase flavoprotein subunit
MAYRAGAEIMNAEFLNHYIPFSKEWTATTRLPIYYFYVNKKAEKVVLKHFPELAAEMRDGKPMEDQVKIVEAVGKEIMAGNGPIRIDTSTATPEELVIVRGKTWDNPALRKHKILPDSWELPKIKAGIDIEREKMELEPVYLGGQGTIRVDLECRTSLNRLWAAGDTCAVGSSWAGARTTGTYPSVGMSFGMVSGYRAGVSASIFAKHNSKPVMDMSQVEMKKNRRYAPLSRGNGPSYHELIYGIHEVTMPMKYNFFRRGDRLREALNKLESVQEKLGEASATDSHTLVKLLETESLAVCAEMTFKAALIRTESRISHKREDFVDSDDRNWLKWIIIQMRNDKMEFRKEPVPLEKYKFRPKQ